MTGMSELDHENAYVFVTKASNYLHIVRQYISVQITGFETRPLQ